MFISEMDEKVQGEIRRELEIAIKMIGQYDEDEIQYHVQQGMDSKLQDLSDTINVDYFTSYTALEKDIYNLLINDYGFLTDGAKGMTEDITRLIKENSTDNRKNN